MLKKYREAIMNKKQLIKKAPDDAIALFSFGDGTVAFYKEGPNNEAERVSKLFTYNNGNVPNEKEFIAVKINNKWHWTRNKYTEAIKLLSKLNYVWIPKHRIWIKKGE
jgi:hypothetical protein